MNLKELRTYKVQVESELAQAERIYGKNKTNHILHLLLSLVTLGGWVVLWLLITLSNISQRKQADKVMKDAYVVLSEIEGRMDDLRSA